MFCSSLDLWAIYPQVLDHSARTLPFLRWMNNPNLLVLLYHVTITSLASISRSPAPIRHSFPSFLFVGWGRWTGIITPAIVYNFRNWSRGLHEFNSFCTQRKLIAGWNTCESVLDENLWRMRTFPSSFSSLLVLLYSVPCKCFAFLRNFTPCKKSAYIELTGSSSPILIYIWVTSHVLTNAYLIEYITF